ncbi:hypothetical protein ETB97_005622 [Aspergillus alliaceus]|uniref:Uncharacterized protein n=1 Tax=Petromyces alliaceus TaxID=209559 RepID=A0A8H6AAY4_PETAA|nr:hypothetical protein ETB97_005622 [Aspergillus burnettii]
MSADLFAEFGFGSPANQSSGTASQQAARPTNRPSSLIPDLEIFDNAPPIDVATSHSIQPRTLPIHLNTPVKHDVSRTADYGNNSAVLFDATLEVPSNDDSEDWGEFESADTQSGQGIPTSFKQGHGDVFDRQGKGPHARKTVVAPNQLDLFDLLSIEDKIPQTHTQASSALVDGTPSHKNRHISSTTPDLAEEEEGAFDEWGDFVDGPPTDASKSVGTQGPASRKMATQSAKPDTKLETKIPSAFGVSSNSVSPARIRPTNIPPPSVLLELFPQLFEKLRKEATEARKNSPEKQDIDGVATLILCTLKAAARVVAGRTLRWKRDSILSQSMRIGPARSGKSGGMKLNTVNKNEDIKEQQEAVDVISIWRDRTALFNSLIQASGRRPIHVIPANIRAIIATPEQGALKASHACALCGLKREERLPKVDDHVEDSFGEWWTDHWGHTDCRQFWENNMSLLTRR